MLRLGVIHNSESSLPQLYRDSFEVRFTLMCSLKDQNRSTERPLVIASVMLSIIKTFSRPSFLCARTPSNHQHVNRVARRSQSQKALQSGASYDVFRANCRENLVTVVFTIKS